MRLFVVLELKFPSSHGPSLLCGPCSSFFRSTFVMSHGSHRRDQLVRTPYTQVLSTLRKTDLVRLCLEFRLPADGSVVVLRKHAKDYLNLHRDRLFWDQRFTALFPRFRRPVEPPPPSSSPPLSPTLSYVSTSSTVSYGSWHGVQRHDDGDPLDMPQVVLKGPVLRTG